MISISGSEQSKQVQTQEAVGSKASVTVSGAGVTKRVFEGDGRTHFYDNWGIVTVTINGFSGIGNFGSMTVPGTDPTTASDVATSLAKQFQLGFLPCDRHGVWRDRNFCFKSHRIGYQQLLTNPSTTINDNDHFTSSPFNFSYVSGSTMSGGADPGYTTVYDAGTVTVTVNGHSTSAPWGQGNSTADVATAMATAINADCAAYVTAAPMGATLNSPLNRAARAAMQYRPVLPPHNMISSLRFRSQLPRTEVLSPGELIFL